MRICWKNLPMAILLSLAVVVGFYFYERPIDELETRVVSSAHPREKLVAFTFDDGPHPITTALLLDTLRRSQVRATFFVVGEKAEENPQLLRRIAAAGHQVACHTYSHLNLADMSAHEARNELVFWERDVNKLIGDQPRYLRPPGGDYDRETLSVLRERGYVLALWSVNPGDWKNPPAEKIVHHVLDRVRPGSIVLMHDDGLNTIRALPTIFGELKRRGYRFVTVRDIAKAAGVVEPARPER